MEFKGISRTFSTIDEKQYETIGAFWDEMSGIYGRENFADSVIIGLQLLSNM